MQQIRPESRSGTGLDLPRAAHSLMVPPLVGGVPVDYGPRLVDNRHAPQTLASRPSLPKTEEEENLPSRLLWVGNVSLETSEALLMQSFAKYGNVQSVAVYPQRNYAFVEFKSLENAKDAKTGLQGKVVGGNALRIEFAKPAKPSKHLWISGVNQTITKEQLEAEFKKFGALEDFKLLRDRKCAIAEYKKLEDAVAAVEGLNKKCMCSEEIRVDFLRSQPLKRASAGMEINLPYVGEEKGNKEGEPSEILWIGFPSSVRVDEERLRRAFILFGEVERIKTFSDRNYCFVQFRNVDEARCAKEGLQGRLFNDPRVQIRFSNTEVGPVGTVKSDGSYVSSLPRREGPTHPELMGPRFPLGGIERIGPSSPKIGTNMPGQHPALQHDIRGSGAMLGLARGIRVVPTSGLGSNSFGKGVVPDAWIPFEGSEVHMNSRGTISPANFGRTNSRLEARPVVDGRIMRDKDYTQREFKRPKVEAFNPSGGFDEAQLFDSHLRGLHVASDLGRGAHEKLQRSLPGGKGDGEQLQVAGSRAYLGPSHVDGILPAITGPGPGIPGHVSASGNVGKPHDYGVINDRWKWQGVIAKAGTFVCRALSFPVGKGIDAALPDVVNCVARTALDMLAQHFNQAVDFGVVFFVPDGDHQSACYQDFVRYLGDKHRAGVAKLSDGTTLFLVPPSEFTERILKLRGDCLFGLILKSPQMGSLPPIHHHQPTLLREHHDRLQQFPQPQLKPFPRDELARDEPAGILKSSLGSQAGWNALSTASSQSETLSLTPALIASLTSLLPQHRQGFNAGGGGSNVSVSGAGGAGAISDVRQAGAVQVKGLTQIESKSGPRTAEVWPRDQIFSPQRTGSAPTTAAELPNRNTHYQTQTTLQQPNMLLLNGPSLTDPQSHAFQVSGPSQVTFRSSGGVPELPAKELTQLATLLSQRRQPPVIQQAAQLVQHQMPPSSQLSSPSHVMPFQNPAQAVQSETNSSGQMFLGQGHGHSNGPTSSQGAGSEQSAGSSQNQGNGEQEPERHNRFQATLQLAAALLQRMHNQSRPQENTPPQ